MPPFSSESSISQALLTPFLPADVADDVARDVAGDVACDVADDVARDVADVSLVIVAPRVPIMICHVASEFWSQIIFTKSSRKIQMFWSQMKCLNRQQIQHYLVTQSGERYNCN
jgi:hypothetical protein